MPTLIAFLGLALYMIGGVINLLGFQKPDSELMSDSLGRNIQFEEPYETEARKFQKVTTSVSFIFMIVGICFLLSLAF